MFLPKLVVLAAVLFVSMVININPVFAQRVPRFVRGDCNFHQIDHISSTGRDAVDIADVAAIMGSIIPFIPSELQFQPPCLDSCDANDDGSFNLGDAIYLLVYLFRGGEKPPEPFEISPGPDPTPDNLDCVAGEPEERLNFVSNILVPPSNVIAFAIGSPLGPGPIMTSPGSTIDVCFYLWNPPRQDIPHIPEGIQGFSVAACFDSDILNVPNNLYIDDRKIVGDYIGVNAENKDSFDPSRTGELIISFFIEIVDPFEWILITEKDEFQLIGCVPFIVNSKATEGECTEILFCDGANGSNSVPIRNLVSAGYLSWPVFPINGQVCIEKEDGIDSDGDGLTDAEEVRLGTDPSNPDTDEDGIFDGYEAQYPGCLNPLEKYDAGFDCDGDNSPSQEEFYYGTDPTKADSLPVWAPEDVYGTPINGGLFLKWKGPKSSAVKGFTVHLEPVGEGGSGGEILDFPVSANENYILITGLNPGSSYRGQVYTWDFAGKKYPSPPDGFYVTSTPSTLPLPTPILKHPIIFVPGAGATPNSPRFQEMKEFLKGLGLLYGGNYWYDRSKKPPVVHSEVDPEGSFYDVTFEVSAGNPTENGRELGEMIQAIKDGRTEKTNKVILICHSLGGISARCYLQNTNVFKNDVEKFITIGTPHLGVFPDNANYRNRNIVGVDRMILEAYYPETDRYSCAPCPWFTPLSCTFDRKNWKISFAKEYVKETIRVLKNGGWDFTKDALAKDLLFSGSRFMNGLNKPTENGLFSGLPKNVEYWALVGRDKGDQRHISPILWAGFMNTFLRNCATNETCQPGCANSNAGDGIISAWSQNLSNSQATLGVKITSKDLFGVNHEEEGQEVESFWQAIGSQPVVFTDHSPVNIEVRDPEGRITSRYRWEIPGAFVREEDIDDDGDTEESISIFLPQAGEYEMKAIPKPEVPPDATYSITIEMNGEITELVKDRPVSEIPDEPEKVFVNTRPVAVINGPELVFVQPGEQAQVRLDGSSSYDIDSDPLTYRWVWDGGSSSETSLLSDLSPGAYKFQLTVNDGFNDSETKEFFVRVISIIRGDANWDGERDISDAIAILGCLFLGTKCPTDPCTLDVNSDGTGDISDAVYLLSFLFLGGPAPKQCLTP